eukprot:TRINITY_DN68041_c1_g1_i1.p1 TRINITY_DN68041_c1_g1~~TRINITY_DN68041_c1_g1_i1.p1  ORF type:complete len:107 (+),score=3.66 TRINITY_DN68041_c1_g1_i1:73-393(+)
MVYIPPGLTPAYWAERGLNIKDPLRFHPHKNLLLYLLSGQLEQLKQRAEDEEIQDHHVFWLASHVVRTLKIVQPHLLEQLNLEDLSPYADVESTQEWIEDVHKSRV